MDRFFFAVGAVLAFIGVAAGAFGAHGLEGRVPVERLATFETGVRYQMYHAFALMLIALAATRWTGSALQVAGWLFIGGTVIFCGTLYALTLGGPRWLGAVTPIGGLAFLAGWAVTAVAILRSGG